MSSGTNKKNLRYPTIEPLWHGLCKKKMRKKEKKKKVDNERERAKEIKIIEVISKNVNVRSQNAKGGIRSSKNERNWKTCKLRMIKLI